MNIASRKSVRGDFYAHILKFRPVKIDLYVIVGINMFIFLSNQKSSLCHGINCGSYEIGTLATAVNWEMNAIAPYGFIVEECSRGVNIQRWKQTENQTANLVAAKKGPFSIL